MLDWCGYDSLVFQLLTQQATVATANIDEIDMLIRLDAWKMCAPVHGSRLTGTARGKKEKEEGRGISGVKSLSKVS